MPAKLLQNMTWEEFSEEVKQDQVVILPVGSTEQHGGHLPVGTDTMVAIALAEAASEKTGAVVAPPIWFGWSPHHMVLPGTITVRPEVLIELVYDVMESLAKHGCKRLILIRGSRPPGLRPARSRRGDRVFPHVALPPRAVPCR